MVIASHNSWTFAPVKQWYLKPFVFTAKCQDKDIREQYKAGARYFDLRLRIENGEVLISHGFMRYDYDYYRLKDDLHFLNNKRDCTVRVWLDVRKEEDIDEKENLAFIKIVSELVDTYTHIKFTDGEILCNHKKLLPDYVKSESNFILDYYSSNNPINYYNFIWYPKLFTYFYNDVIDFDYAKTNFIVRKDFI